MIKEISDYFDSLRRNASPSNDAPHQSAFDSLIVCYQALFTTKWDSHY